MKARIWLILGSAVIGVVVLVWIVSALSSGVPVEVATAKRQLIREFVDERAITRLPRTYLITMPFNGRIEEITLQEGMAVKKGDENDPNNYVARIVPRDVQLAVEQGDAAHKALEARIRENADNTVEETGYRQTVDFVKSMNATVDAAAARVQAGRARHAYAESNLGRVRSAAGSGAYTKDDLERAILRELEARVDYQQDTLVHDAMMAMQAATNLMPTMVRQYIARKGLTGNVLQEEKAEAWARMQQVRQDEQRGTMRSPVDGVVLRRHVTDERFLTAGQSLLEIGRLEDLEVEADVLSLDVVEAQPGHQVKIYGPAIGEPPASGTVARVYPAGFTKVSSLGVEQQRVKVIIHFDPDDLRRLRQQQNLGVGYRCRVQITTAEKSDALVVPRSALFRGTDGQWQVYAIRDGRAKLKEVEVGLINDDTAEITSELAEGEQVVLAPESNLTDGARVEVKGEKAAQEESAAK